MNQTYKTTEAFVSGGICGSLWMPAVEGGKPFRVSLRGPWGIMDRFTEPVSFRDALLCYLSENGGDFQNPEFTADTRICVIRKRNDGAGRYTVHVWEREVAQIESLSDLVNNDAYTGDFMGDGE
jgi:hypothetical protein